MTLGASHFAFVKQFAASLDVAKFPGIAGRGIDVADIVEFSTLSRRQLERRFRQHLDRTPREEITAVQIRRLKQLLGETEMPLEQIAPLAGYNHVESMSVTFKLRPEATFSDSSMTASMSVTRYSFPSAST